MRLKKDLAEAMARDIVAARRRILRRATPEETYELMVLSDDLKHMAHLSWMDSLADRFGRGQHHLGKNFDLGPGEAEALGQEMAQDMRDIADRTREFDSERQP